MFKKSLLTKTLNNIINFSKIQLVVYYQCCIRAQGIVICQLNSYCSGKCRSHGFHNSELRVKFQLDYLHFSVNTNIGTLKGRSKCLQYPKIILLFN